MSEMNQVSSKKAVTFDMTLATTKELTDFLHNVPKDTEYLTICDKSKLKKYELLPSDFNLLKLLPKLKLVRASLMTSGTLYSLIIRNWPRLPDYMVEKLMAHMSDWAIDIDDHPHKNIYLVFNMVNIKESGDDPTKFVKEYMEANQFTKDVLYVSNTNIQFIHVRHVSDSC